MYRDELLVHHEPLADLLSEIADTTGMKIVLLSGDEPFFTEPLKALLSGIS